MRRTLGALTVLVALGAAPLAIAAPPAPQKPNVLLVTVDTLRADHLGPYGYPLPTSPRLDALAAAGVRLDAVTATAPETAPATASLLTGLYQPRHRVAANRDILQPDVTTLAEHLRAAGYATAGLVGNELVSAQFGFAQGCDLFDLFDPDWTSRADATGVTAALAWIGEKRTAPWFLWLHLMDPHGPYAPAPEWIAGARYPADAFGADEPIPVGLGNFGLGIIPRYQVMPGETRLSQYVKRYDGEINFTDAQIGRLIDGIGAQGASARTLVVVTADHGESLTERSEYLQHGWFVYENTVRIPLIAVWPGVLPAGTSVARPVSAVDLAPTILTLALGGVPAGAALDGANVAAVLKGQPAPAEEGIAFAVGARENHPFSARKGKWKLIHTRGAPPPIPVSRLALKPLDVPERIELYDLAADPGETRNVAAEHPDETAALLEKVQAFRRTFRMGGLDW
jgi:arylsulfatase A-like enzyme